ncbi:hypothetical protein EDB84DRAFT_1593401 [Lactarius hengduanensis]|nr:hypothetical protein EDB84DRAFT_1593401 [Lactarius hengduanensis]
MLSSPTRCRRPHVVVAHTLSSPTRRRRPHVVVAHTSSSLPARRRRCPPVVVAAHPSSSPTRRRRRPPVVVAARPSSSLPAPPSLCPAVAAHPAAVVATRPFVVVTCTIPSSPHCAVVFDIAISPRCRHHLTIVASPPSSSLAACINVQSWDSGFSVDDSGRYARAAARGDTAVT